MLKDQIEDKICGICWNPKEKIIECIMKNKLYLKKCNITNEYKKLIWNGCKGKICLECYESLRNYNKCPFCNIEKLIINEARFKEIRYPNYLKNLQMLSIMLSFLLILIFISIIKIIYNNYIDDKFIIFITFVIIITNICSIISDTLPNIIGFIYLL